MKADKSLVKYYRKHREAFSTLSGLSCLEQDTFL